MDILQSTRSSSYRRFPFGPFLSTLACRSQMGHLQSRSMCPANCPTVPAKALRRCPVLCRWRNAYRHPLTTFTTTLAACATSHRLVTLPTHSSVVGRRKRLLQPYRRPMAFSGSTSRVSFSLPFRAAHFGFMLIWKHCFQFLLAQTTTTSTAALRCSSLRTPTSRYMSGLLLQLFGGGFKLIIQVHCSPS